MGRPRRLIARHGTSSVMTIFRARSLQGWRRTVIGVVRALAGSVRPGAGGAVGGRSRGDVRLAGCTVHVAVGMLLLRMPGMMSWVLHLSRRAGVSRMLGRGAVLGRRTPWPTVPQGGARPLAAVLMVFYWSFWDGRQLLARLSPQARWRRTTEGVGPHHDTLGAAVPVDWMGLAIGGKGRLASHHRLEVDYICGSDSTGVYHWRGSVGRAGPGFRTNKAGPLLGKTNKFVTCVVKACVNSMLEICWRRNLHFLFLLRKHLAQACSLTKRRIEAASRSDMR